MTTSAEAKGSAVEIGDVLNGRYRIDALLGSGGMGSVYLAEHVRIGRAVAVKVLDTQVGADHEATQRFKREALASGRLDHPNIVAVSDFGLLADGRSYLVMEALEGESLGARLEQRAAMPWREAVATASSILQGLQHAHDRGVVHRDIKPDNIFLATKDGQMAVKILDFGIAKLVGGEPEDSVTATRAGMTVGTPAYLSPEQAVGGTITPASDLYSTTVVLFEMLAGRPPFMGQDLVSVMLSHVSKSPPTLAEVVPMLDVPAQLDAIITRGLQKLVADRISSAREYLALLDDVVRSAGGRVDPRRDSQPVMVQFAQTSPALEASRGRAPSEVGAVGDLLATRTPRLDRRATTFADGGPPARRAWLIGGAVTLVLVIAFALISHDDEARSRVVSSRDAAVMEPSSHLPARPVVVIDSTAPPPAADIPSPTPPVESAADRDAKLKAALYGLTMGKTCPARRTAIAPLVELGDPRAIQPLKAARYRMVGGVLGFNQSNANACLRADADAAIKKLMKPRP